MKIKLILMGMAAGLLLPLAAANAGAGFAPGLNQAGATDLERGAPIAGSFWRSGGDDNDHDKDDKDHKGDHKCRHGDDGDHGDCCDHDGDHDNWLDKGDHHHKCEKSPSKPGKDECCHHDD